MRRRVGEAGFPLPARSGSGYVSGMISFFLRMLPALLRRNRRSGDPGEQIHVVDKADDGHVNW